MSSRCAHLDMLTYIEEPVHAIEKDIDRQAENDPNAKL